MVNSILSELHQILLGLGYCYISSNKLPKDSPILKYSHSTGFYQKEFVTSGGKFCVLLDISKDPHLLLPTACLLSIPDHYKGRLLPHINFGWFLCYVEQMEADWDPNDLYSTYYCVDTQIKETLQIVANSNSESTDQGLEGEFSAYWLADRTVYLLSQTQPLQAKTLDLCIVNQEKKSRWVLFDQNDVAEYQKWLHLNKFNETKKYTCSSSCFRVNPKKLSGLSWPPENFKAFLAWLNEVDSHTLSNLLQYFAAHTKKRHFLLFDVLGYGLIALYVAINSNKAALKSYSGKHRKTKKNPRKLREANLLSVLKNPLVVEQFIRLRVEKLDKESLLARNRPRPEVGDLRTKKIALIGCGTIGGYLAPLLLRSGAGCGDGYLHLYDPGIFEPENYGRHSLTSEAFQTNKAEATTRMLHQSIHFTTTIEAFDSYFPITKINLRKYDIIIDATGRPTVSKRLACVVREIDSGARPVIIHGFNDGFGRASKVFIDNGQSCFGCLISERGFYKNGTDLRFENLNRHNEQRISCGSTFTPYDAAVSVVTAGLMQEAALYTLEHHYEWTYKEHFFDGSRARKPKILSQNDNCVVCNA